MKPEDFVRTHRKLDFNGPPPGRSLFGTIFPIACAIVLAAIGLAFSLLILAVASIAGLLGFSYLWWKSRDIRKQMREQMEWHAEPLRRYGSGGISPPQSDSAMGDIVEGEVIGEEREKHQ